MTLPGSAVGPAVAFDQAYNGTRIELDSATTIALVPYIGDWITVARLPYETSQFALLDASSNDMLADGTDSGVVLPSGTLLYVYACTAVPDFPMTLAASLVAPTKVAGDYYLGTTGDTIYARFVGCVRMVAGNFVDSLDSRLVWNQWNRIPKSMFVCPNYANDSADTTYNVSLSGFNPLNGGSSDTFLFITGPTSDGVSGDTCTITLVATNSADTTDLVRFAIAVNGSGDSEVGCSLPIGAVLGSTAVASKTFKSDPTWITEQAQMLCDTNSATLSLYADFVASGVLANDVAATYMSGLVWC